MDEDEAFSLIPAKRLKFTNFALCIICQKDNKDECLRKGKHTSIEKVIKVSTFRKDEVCDRLNCSLEELENRDVFWHNSCYATYTSQHNIQRLVYNVDNEEDDNSARNIRVRRISFDWSKCIFCKQASHKKDIKLINIATFEACKSIKCAAEARDDTDFLRVIQGVDLIACEAKYHKSCHASYVSKSNIKSKCSSDNPATVHDEAFNELLEIIKPEISAGKAYNMNCLLELYKDQLDKRGAEANSYTKQKLKSRLQSHFRDSIVFHKPIESTKPEILFSSSISLVEVINFAARMHKSEELIQNNKTEDQEIYNTAATIKKDVLECVGIDINPLSVDNINLQKAKAIIPDSLYWLLRFMITSDEYGCNTNSCSSIASERKILTIAQDIVHAITNAKVKLPKHVGLGITVKHLTRSKQLITLLNRMGHCCSYEETELVETSIANEMIARSEMTNGVPIPLSITPGMFVHMAADNDDFCEETLDGKNTTHATTIVVFQRKQYGPFPERQIYGDHSQKRRSLSTTRPLVPVEEISITGRHPPMTEYLNKLKNAEWLNISDQCCSTIKDDMVWLLLRLNPDGLFERMNRPINDQQVPGWSGFQSLRFLDTSQLPTTIGYCPMIQADASKYSTIYTVMKLSLNMANALGQSDVAVTFDLAIYIKAKHIQLRYPDEFKKIVVRLGGFHIALNFLSLLGKMYTNSGLEDLLIDSGIYASGTTNALMAGKSYNRGVRAHKLCLEALFRVMWFAFLNWLEAKKPTFEDQSKQELVQLVSKCREAGRDLSKNWASIREQFHTILTLLDEFRSEAKSKSKLFAFWDQYMTMVMYMLQFIKAERTANWDLHLASTAALMPYFYAMDRINYARWLPVYLADMYSLQENHPEVYAEFKNGNHSVCRSQQPFCQVWSDMALEQSINLDTKSKGGLVGMTKNDDAVNRWFLTSHERAAITRSMKEMCNLEDDRVGSHKESSTKRITRDEKDVESLVQRFTSDMMMNPFTLSDEESADTEPLINIATGVVLPDKVADCLINSADIGQSHMLDFVSSRLNSNKVSFWEPLRTVKIATFKVSNKKTSTATNEKVITLNADRDLFGRLLVVARVRDIDLKDVLSYELCSVPVALVHPDGTLRKTPKSSLMAILEKNVESSARFPVSEKDTAVIIDAMAMIQTVKSAGATTFADMVQEYSTIIVRLLSQNNCSRVDLVFDQYKSQSIKSFERQRRGETNAIEVKIQHQNTPIPKQWAKFMSNPKNKKNLAKFLSSNLAEVLKEKLQPSQQVLLAGGFTDGKETLWISSGSSHHVPTLYSDHEEADTRLLLHAKHASNSHQRVIIHSPDTDVAVLCLNQYRSIQESQYNELWLKTGVSDKARFIPIHILYTNLHPLLLQCLPAFHAITGCDTTSSFFGIGKKSAWDVLIKDPQLQQQLVSLGEQPFITEDALKSCEAFVCNLYTTSRLFTSTDDARYFLFCQKNKKSEDLPPTSESLCHHLKRANYQVHIWKKALTSVQNLPSPEGYGWKIEDGQLLPILMTKQPAPKEITELVTCACKKSSCSRNCSCKANDLPCTEACVCMADDSCLNPMNDTTADDDTDSSSDSESDDNEDM